MRFLILAVLLSIAQTPSAVSRKAPASDTVTGQSVTKEPKGDKAPSAQSPAPAAPTTDGRQEHPCNSSASEDTRQGVRVGELLPVAIKKDWADWGIWVFSGLLVVVGFLQWCVIRRQAGLMEVHAEHLGALADAGIDNAASARINTNALLSSERALVLGEVAPMSDPLPGPDQMQFYWIHVLAKNYGRTPARIRQVAARAEIIPKGQGLPPTPDYPTDQGGINLPLDVVLPPGVAMPPIPVLVIGPLMTGVQQGSQTLYVHGFVKYLDLGNTERHSGFCYVYYIKVDSGSPSPTGFYADFLAPRAYTECT